MTPRKVETKKEKYADLAMGQELSSQYQTPKIQSGKTLNNIPAGYTQHSVEIQNMDPDMSRQSPDRPMNFANGPHQTNHIGNNVQNGPTSVHPQYQQQYAPDPNYNTAAHHQRQSQRMSASQKQQSPVHQQYQRPDGAPPPPPPNQASLSHRPSVSSPHRNNMPAPPPPPPPPPMLMAKKTAPDTISVSSDNSTQSSMTSASVEPPPPPKQTARNALLEEIRLGKYCSLYYMYTSQTILVP